MRQFWVLTQFKFSLLPGTRLVKIIFWDKLTFWTKPYLFLRHCVDCRVSCVLCWLHCVCKKNRGQSGWSGGVSPIRGVDGKAVNEPNGNYNSWTAIERFKLSWEISVNSTTRSIFFKFQDLWTFFTPQQCFVIFLLIIDVIAMGWEHFQRGAQGRFSCLLQRMGGGGGVIRMTPLHCRSFEPSWPYVLYWGHVINVWRRRTLLGSYVWFR